jgi:long-subunit fatty acid transport protein
MKKVFLSMITILSLGFANAQEVKFGLKGGLNVANLSFSGNGAPSTSSLVGFHIGGFTEIKVSDKFSVQPELLYSTQGAKFKMSQDGVTLNSFKLGYINLPVMAKYYVAKNFSLEAGPQLGFLTSAKANASGSGTTVDVDVKKIFETIDFGLNFGAAYDLTEKFSAGLRYNLGLSNIAKTEEGDSDTVKNSVFSLSIGYKF